MSETVVNPFLDGNFAPIRQEITAEDLEVIGELPAQLAGMFVRNGPNPQFNPQGQYHWFDGDGMLHGVSIKNGKAQYLNRYVRTQGFKLEREAGKNIWTGLLEPPQMDNPYGPSKNTANTALVYHAEKFLALWEGGAPHQITTSGLETIGPYSYNEKLNCPFTAHPKVDPLTGEMMFLGYSLAEPPFLQYGIVGTDGELAKTIPIDLPVGVMMHDFAITEKYTIFLDLPFTFRPERMEQGKPAFMFESDSPSRFGIMPRHGDNNSIRWFETSPCYIFHTLNAYEEGDEVVLIACRMNSTNVFVSDEGKRDPEGDIPRLYRWRFNLATGLVKEEMLDETPGEFPRVNEGKLGSKTRYGYVAKIAPAPVPLFEGLIKYDFAQGTSQTHLFGTRCYGGEAVFAPNPDATEEDSGWLITFVHNEESGKSELVVVNAQDMSAPPVARVKLPQRVPYGFHGTWLAENQL